MILLQKYINKQGKQSVLGVKEMGNRGWGEGATGKHSAEKVWDWKKARMMNEQKGEKEGGGPEIHLKIEIKVAAGAVSNPVRLHGFDPVPLRKVCQGVQERLQEEGHKFSTLYNFGKSYFPL